MSPLSARRTACSGLRVRGERRRVASARRTMAGRDRLALDLVTHPEDQSVEHGTSATQRGAAPAFAIPDAGRPGLCAPLQRMEVLAARRPLSKWIGLWGCLAGCVAMSATRDQPTATCQPMERQPGGKDVTWVPTCDA